MMKEILKQIIVSNQQRIFERKLINREFKVQKDVNYAFTGPRRSGKTYMLYQIARRFYKKNPRQVVFINFEDERLLDFKVSDFDLIIQAYKEIFDFDPVFFFDEIQNVSGWEKFVRRLADSGYRCYITGSNAQMLSKEIATTLGGRFIVKEVFPLDFFEFLKFHRFKIDKTTLYSEERVIKLNRLFREYFYFGGFPETVGLEDKREYLSNLFMKVFYSDILARYNLRNEFVLKFIIKKLAENIHDEISFNRLRNLIVSSGIQISINTVIDYVTYLQEAYLIFPLQNFLGAFAERQTKKKYYFVDNGILNLFLVNPETKLLENLVFWILRRKYSNLFYLRSGTAKVDFFIPDVALVQVAYSLDDKTLSRELKSLETAKKHCLDCQKILVTFDTKKYNLPTDVKLFTALEFILNFIQ